MTGAPQGEQESIHHIADGRITVIPERSITIVDGQVLSLSRQKLRILELLAKQPDHVVGTGELCEEIWDKDNEEVRRLARVHLVGLRHELGDELGHIQEGAIRTHHCAGYMAVSALDGVSTLSGVEANEDLYVIADERIAINCTARAVHTDDRLRHDITRTEFDLLAALAREPDTVIQRDLLLEAVWGGRGKKTYDSARATILHLRDKLGPELGHTKRGAIRTRYGIGYYAVTSLDQK